MARQARLRSSTARRSKPLGKRNGGPSRKTLAAFACGQKGPRRRAEAACFDTPAGGLALQLRSWEMSESMGNHDSEIVDAGSVD